MIELFSTEKAIGICLKNNTPYVKLAVEDLRRDFARVSTSRFTVIPTVYGGTGDNGI